MAPTGRIDSMDQFRGYTVAGMFVVNFLGDLAAVHAVFKHHNTYFSYADTIMPSFMFACGFAYRLTVLRRLREMGAGRTYARGVSRSLGLVPRVCASLSPGC
jgi:predicted acyltransferase